MKARSKEALPRRPAGAGRATAQLTEALRTRQAEIVRATLTRIFSIADPGEAGDPTYVEGLRAAVAAGVEYGLDGIESGEEEDTGAVPLVLLSQVRLAARNGVGLDTVLRRYFAGYALLGDFLIEEAEGASLDGAGLKRLLRTQAGLFDRLLTVVSTEYGREAQSRPSNAEQRRVERIKRLLDGELVDGGELDWDFEAFHLAIAASGPDASRALRSFASSQERRLLIAPQGRGTVWAWFGAKGPSELTALASRIPAGRFTGCALALGEPAQGLSGWRLSHRQASAALPIACRRPERMVRYADVAVLACVLSDELLATSLRQLYLDPLEAGRDGGKAARQTLRAYLAAERNISSTAAALGVNRHTVASRLRGVEKHLGFSLDAHIADLEMALRLEELSRMPPAHLAGAV